MVQKYSENMNLASKLLVFLLFTVILSTVRMRFAYKSKLYALQT